MFDLQSWHGSGQIDYPWRIHGTIVYNILEDPDFGWSLGLALRRFPSKIEVIWVLGTYMKTIKINQMQVDIPYMDPIDYPKPVFLGYKLEGLPWSNHPPCNGGIPNTGDKILVAMKLAQMDSVDSQSGHFPRCPFCHSEAEVLLGGWKEACQKKRRKRSSSTRLKKCVALVCDTHATRKNLPWTTSWPLKNIPLKKKQKEVNHLKHQFSGANCYSSFRECRFVGNSKTPSFDGYILVGGFNPSEKY